MADPKHTPGPWFAYGRYIGTKNHKSAVGECRDVNGNWSDDAKSSADARLIAAAPDFLKAAKAYIAQIDAVGLPDDDVTTMFRAAISKAEPARQSATTVPQGGKSE
jgi:hypothetical protein